MDPLGFQPGFYDNDPTGRSLLMSGSAVADVGVGQMGSPDAHAMMLMKQKQAAALQQQEQAMMSMSMPMPMMANSANLEMEMMMMKEQQAMQQQQQRAMMMGMPPQAAACNMEMEMMMRRNARAQQIEQMELQQRQQKQIQMRQMMQKQQQQQQQAQERQRRQQSQQLLLQQSQKVNVEQQANMLRQLELMKRMDDKGGDGGSNNSKGCPDEISSLGGSGGMFGGGAGANGCFPVKSLSGANAMGTTRNSFNALMNRGGAGLADPTDINFSIGVTSTAKLTDLQMDRILRDGTNKLVFVNDRDLISDALLISIAQLEPCVFRDRDRVGCYKSRPIGFVGLSCKHCGGQPGFGRFFPNTVRSLAQTTTSQTIIKHIATNCPSVPAPIREVVQDCQRQELEIAVHNDNLNANAGGSSKRVTRYGSRKIFFQGLWSRLHDDLGKKLIEKNPAEEEDKQAGEDKRPDDDASNKTPELHDSSTTAAESLDGPREGEETSSKDDDGGNAPRKDDSPDGKEKKRERSHQDRDENEADDTNKRPRVD